MARDDRRLYMGMVPPGARPASDVYLEDGETVEAAVTELQAQADKKFELIETIELTEDVSTIIRSTTPEGDAYDFSDVIIRYTSGAAASNAPVWLYVNDQMLFRTGVPYIETTGTQTGTMGASVIGGKCFAFNTATRAAYPNNNQSAIAIYTMPYSFGPMPLGKIEKIQITGVSANIPAGTIVEIFAK